MRLIFFTGQNVNIDVSQFCQLLMNTIHIVGCSVTLKGYRKPKLIAYFKDKILFMRGETLKLIKCEQDLLLLHFLELQRYCGDGTEVASRTSPNLLMQQVH